MHCSEAVCETRVFGSLIGEVCEPELSDSTEALKFRRIDQIDEQSPLGDGCVDLNDVMNGISVVSR